jgi:PAS domain S-box-containing protein
MNTPNATGQQWNERCNANQSPLGDTDTMFRLLFERSADAMSLFDPETGRFIESNDAVARLIGAPDRHALGNASPAQISPKRQPDGQLSSQKAEAMARLAIEKGSHRFEWVARRYDGTEQPLDIVMTAIPSGKRPLLLVVARDVSAQKRAENEILQLNFSLEKRVAERTVELVLANQQLKSEVTERQRKEKFQRALFQISEAVHTADDLNSLYAKIHAIVKTLMPAENFYLALLDEATQTISFPYWVNALGELAPETRPANVGRTGDVLRSGRSLLVAGRAWPAHPATQPIEPGALHQPTAIWLGAPLLSQGRAFGVMALGDYQNESAYGDNEKQILAFIAEQTAVAILRKRSEQELHRRTGQVQKHRDVLLELAQSNKSDFHTALEKICWLAASTLNVARVSYWSLADNDSAILCEHLHLLATRKGDDKAKGTRLAVHHCPAYFEALGTKRPIIANRAVEHEATSALAETYLKPLGISSMLDAPVWVRGEVVGVLCHEHIGPARDWTPEEVDFASAVASMVSLALEESQRARSESRLRESEERFSAAFRASPVFITISRFDNGRYVLANEAFLKWTEYRRDEVLGRDSAELALWADPHERDLFWDELRRIGSIRERECRVRNRNGTVFTMLLSADIIEVNRVPHLLTVGLDITQRKHAEAELHKTVAREKELGQLRSSFVSMVSHEFRTPLGIIQSSAEILEDYLDRLEPTERKEHLQSIHKNTQRMARLMEEVLLIGSIEAGKMEFKPAPLALRTFASRLVDEVLSATDQRCRIELLAEDLPEIGHADERLLRHIFTNLLTNAVKYSSAGSLVRFEITRRDTHAVFSIRDEGIGIPEADREWLFSAFHRGRNVGDRPGTGLGLVIVKRCVDLHGGSIEVKSALGVGTSVTVELSVFAGIDGAGFQQNGRGKSEAALTATDQTRKIE